MTAATERERRAVSEDGARPDENPLLEGLELRRTPEPCALVIFGASGDLTRRKLLPAVYALALRGLLPERFAVLGAARTEQSTEDWVGQMEDAVRKHGRDRFREDVWRRLAEGMRYVATEFDSEQGEDEVADALRELDEERGTAGTASSTSPYRPTPSSRSCARSPSGAPGRAGRG